MNLGNLRVLARLTIPEAKINRINNTNLDLIINEVVKDINLRLKLLNQDEKFDVTAEKYKYDLSSSAETVTRFAKIDDLGLYWNAGSSTTPDWTRLIPKTLKWLDDNIPQWRDAGSGDPLYYAKKGKYLYIHPTPDTALTDGFWLYFIEGAQAMSEDAHYPFGYSSEIEEYAILTDAIIKGIEWWITPMVGEEKGSILEEYLAILNIKKSMLKENLDITSDKETRLRVPHVC